MGAGKNELRTKDGEENTNNRNYDATKKNKGTEANISIKREKGEKEKKWFEKRTEEELNGLENQEKKNDGEADNEEHRR